jgi:hypothetical protein
MSDELIETRRMERWVNLIIFNQLRWFGLYGQRKTLRDACDSKMDTMGWLAVEISLGRNYSRHATKAKDQRVAQSKRPKTHFPIDYNSLKP